MRSRTNLALARAGAALIVFTCVVAGCSGGGQSDSPPAAAPSGPTIETGEDVLLGRMEAAQPGRPVATYIGNVCLSGPGSVELKAVTPATADSGLKVTAFTLAAPGGAGMYYGHIAENPEYGPITHTLTDTCDSKPGVGLFVELKKTSPANAGTEQFAIQYTSADVPMESTVNWGIVLCAADLDSEACSSFRP